MPGSPPPDDLVKKPAVTIVAQWSSWTENLSRLSLAIESSLFMMSLLQSRDVRTKYVLAVKTSRERFL